MHLLLTRPEAGAEPDPLHEALVDGGHGIISAPLLTIVHSPAMPSLEGVQALIATSRNGLRALAASSLLAAAIPLPLFAVGPATASLGRKLGFHRVIEGSGGARDLLPLIVGKIDPGAGTLLHLAGDKLAFDLKGTLQEQGFSIRTEIVYFAEPATALPSEVVVAMRHGLLGGVVLMSPRTAKVYVKLVGEAALTDEARRLIYLCLSEAVARELQPLGNVRTAVARLPNSQEMLALVAREAPDSA